MKIGRQYPGRPEQELDALIAGIQGGWNREHDAEGAHLDIKADSLTVEGGGGLATSDGKPMAFEAPPFWEAGPWLLATSTTARSLPHPAVATFPLAASVNDWNPLGMADAVIAQVIPSGAFNVTGILAPQLTLVSPPAYASLKVLLNVSGFPITLKHASVSSSPLNRFYLPGGVDFVLQAGAACWLTYSKVQNNGGWYVTSGLPSVLPATSIPNPLPAVDGSLLTNLNASQLLLGIVPDGRFPAILPAVSGQNLTNLDAADLVGTLPPGALPANVALRDTSNVFTQPQFLSAANPTLWFGDSSGPVDGKNFRIIIAGGTIYFQTFNDALSVGFSPITMDFAGNVYIQGALQAAGGLGTTPLSAPWVDVPYNASNFSATGGMAFSVLAGNQATYAYRLIGSSMLVSFWIDGAGISGTPSANLRLALPLYPAARQMVNACHAINNGTHIPAFCYVHPSDPWINILRADTANWTTPSFNTGVSGQIEYQV